MTSTRRTAAGSVTAPRIRRGPPQRSHTSTSNPNTRWSTRAYYTRLLILLRTGSSHWHRGGGKRIVASDGNAIVPTAKPQLEGTLVKALARAWRWQRMLDEGV